MVVTKMIKICGDSLTVLLIIILKQSLKEGDFPEIWKKACVVVVHKKRLKPLKKLSSISLFLIFSKTFQRVIYRSIFNCFQKNKLFTSSTTAQKMKFSIKDFFSKCDQIRSFLRIRSHLLCSEHQVCYLVIHILPNYIRLYMKCKQHLIKKQMLI